MVREIQSTELKELLNLYLDLHETSVPEVTPNLMETWQAILTDPNHHIIVNVVEGVIVSSVVCVIIPNLTRGIRPYAFIENVVTHHSHRGKGYASMCLAYAREIAIRENCYKMMLLTGSREESTLKFYERAGFNSEDKTAFIQWL